MWFALLACAPPPTDTAPELVDAFASVDPLIGTGGNGFRVGSSTPAAALPFGEVRLGPDTDSGYGVFEAYHCSGYYYDDAYISGFSHLHMHGVGVSDEGDLQFSPMDGWDPAYVDSGARIQAYHHENERAVAGRYQVTFDNGISADLSVTDHVGHHQYVWPEDADPVLVIDLQHNLDGSNSGAEVHVDTATNTIEGWTLNTGSFSGGTSAFKVYFSAVFDTGIESYATWGDDSPQTWRPDASGVDVGVWIRSPSRGARVRVGISVVSLEGARANLATELPDDQGVSLTAQAAADVWRAKLAPVRIYGGDTQERRIFYTSLYHVLQMPTLYADADGAWHGFDGETHPYSGFWFHSDLSLWDTYRTAHPFYDLVYPDDAREFANSLVAMAQTGGAYPRWPVAGGEGGSMLGAPADIALADAWMRGVRDWDVGTGWPLLVKQERGEIAVPYNGRPGIADLEAYGYLPSDLYGSSVAWVQELAWADAAMANLADGLGQADQAEYFRTLSATWKNQWDPTVGFFHARTSDGSFAAGFSDTLWTDEYTEGTAWQYLWPSFWDPAALADTLGGRDAALERLDTFFDEAVALGAIDGPPTWYWHGNEPDLHAAWLYTLWGEPDATQDRVKWIRDTWYDDAPVGLAGNDDAGTLSAWYLFAAMGLYPVAGTSTWVLGRPLFPEVDLDLRLGTLVLRREGDGAHVDHVELDGVRVDGPTIDQSELAAGGELVFYTSP